MIFTYFRTREGKVSGLKTICVTDAVLIWIPDLPVVSPLVLFARATTNPLLYLYFTKSWPRADGFFFSPLVFIFGLWDCHVFLSAALFFYQTPAITACMQSRTSLKENRPQSQGENKISLENKSVQRKINISSGISKKFFQLVIAFAQSESVTRSFFDSIKLCQYVRQTRQFRNVRTNNSYLKTDLFAFYYRKPL